MNVKLIEREHELSKLSMLLDEVKLGKGSTVLIEGPAGIGKTTVVTAARALAAERNIRTLSAVGGELEQDLPFAIMRQLFELPVRLNTHGLLSGAARFAAPVFGLDEVPEAEGSLGSIVHGLYWICSNLAEGGPLLLLIDDAHWSDEASLRVVSHLSRRIADLPVLLVLSHRPQPPAASLARALSGVGVHKLALGPLSEYGVREMIRELMSPDADDEFCIACARVSGGNPFLLVEAISSLQADRVQPFARQAPRVEDLRPETISQAVLARVARLGTDTVRLARAIAVLGLAADSHHAGMLANLTPARTAELTEMLVREEIITSGRPILFVHPLVRNAIYADGSESIRAIDHKRVAVLLAAEGFPPERLVPHLLAAEPQADPQVVGWLRAAGDQALKQAAPEVAAACLARALAEPAQAAERRTLFATLGRALGMANRAVEAAAAFRSARELAVEPAAKAELSMELGSLMVQTGQVTEALASYEEARDAFGGDDRRLLRQYHAGFVMAAFVAMQPPNLWINRLEKEVHEGPNSDEVSRLILATIAFGSAAAGDRTATETVALATQAAGRELPSRDRWILINFASAALAVADELPASLELLDRGIVEAQRVGDVAEFRYLSMLRSHTALYAGRLLEAEADGRAALALHEIEETHEVPLAASVLVDALVERGFLAEAESIVAERHLRELSSVNMLIDHVVFMARGHLRMAQGRPRDALVDFITCGESLTSAGYVNPGFARWRSQAAMAHLLLGENHLARELAELDLELARKYEAPGPIGIALRVAGLAEGGERGLGLLEEAVFVLSGSGAELEFARSLIDYGAALRRSGSRRLALQPLRQGLDFATRCKSQTLIDRANTELIAAGARPRRNRLTGPESLTASELRVARLAADGTTNREIAQALFVSRRTIEVHLTSVYRKLGISSRQELKHLLLASSGPEPRFRDDLEAKPR